jgi:hypothetical protein
MNPCEGTGSEGAVGRPAVLHNCSILPVRVALPQYQAVRRDTRLHGFQSGNTGAIVMDRRAFLRTAAAATAAGGLATPAISQRAAARALRFVPQADLANFDPIWTTTLVVRSAAVLVWDTLYGVDASWRRSARWSKPRRCRQTD